MMHFNNTLSTIYLTLTPNRRSLSSPSDEVNLGVSVNPQAKPTDFDFLAVIGKGTFGKVLLAKLKADGKFYAVKVLQKKVILKKKEQKNIMAERNVLLKSLKHPFLVGLHYSFQTSEKLYFVLDYVNGGEPPFYSRDVSEMYDGILHKPLQLPPGKSQASSHLLYGLLQKDQHRRIGAIADFLEIKNHVFFAPINWDDLYHKRITPPYNPNVRGPADLQHIDPEFTRETVPNSVGRTPDPTPSLATSSSNAFNGFSYISGEDSFL
ncbi:hypothetical protein cypCar_00042585 [Cyprinus carpio]|nr:hypothetical protein cypCar_00042585 [Cyprinus carpio]